MVTSGLATIRQEPIDQAVSSPTASAWIGHIWKRMQEPCLGSSLQLPALCCFPKRLFCAEAIISRSNGMVAKRVM
jgi:hypothetical protein